MEPTQAKAPDEVERSRRVAEESREAAWRGTSFLRELFLGRLRMELIHPFPLFSRVRPEFRQFHQAMEELLTNVDPAQIDAEGEYPPKVIEELKRLGAFGMKIPVEYGGLGFDQVEYGKVMQLVGGRDANLTALLSAHQSIGVPQPLVRFGTEALKQKYLPRCAHGAISAFALTEAGVGSDPARLSTTAELSEDGESYILNGSKLWCTNGTLAELLVVMARNPRNNAISAFVVETAWPGVEVTHRLHFMGLSALSNAALRFTDVRVPRENLIGEEGKGLKIALTTLNTGRLSLPAALVGGVKNCLELSRKWSAARVQWGQEIGKHEAIAHKLADMAITIFAMESLSDLAQALADTPGYDIRLEAAAAKEWNSVEAWRLFDATMQIRGGRGYEKERSLAARGEAAVGVERWMRDSRINLIFEGSSEIMHLFMAREAVDRHLQVAGALIDPKLPIKQKLARLPRVAAFYLGWYPRLWVGWPFRPWYLSFGRLGRHLRYVERASRKLARQVFHAMVVYRGATERKQAFLFRLVDIANELLAIAASVSRATALRDGHPQAKRAMVLADRFSRMHRHKVNTLFHALWHNDDVAQYRLGRDVLVGDEAWLERGRLSLGLSIDDLRPRDPTVQESPPPDERPAGEAGLTNSQSLH